MSGLPARLIRQVSRTTRIQSDSGRCGTESTCICSLLSVLYRCVPRASVDRSARGASITTTVAYLPLKHRLGLQLPFDCHSTFRLIKSTAPTTIGQKFDMNIFTSPKLVVQYIHDKAIYHIHFQLSLNGAAGIVERS